MRVGGRLIALLTQLMQDRFHGSVTIRFEGGKVAHVDASVKKSWKYEDLPPSLPCDGELDLL